MNISTKVLFVFVMLTLTGCAVPVDRYHAAGDNQSKIKTFKQKFNVEKFTAKKTEKQVMCRMANNVAMTDKMSFENYIENALIEELKMAEAYSKESNITIKGHLNSMDVSSGVTDAHWTLNLTITNPEGDWFIVEHKREYSASFIGGIACGSDMPKSYMPTVQELIGKIINHPEFERLFILETNQ